MMKATIFFLLLLVAVVSCSNSFQKAELGASMVARITSQALLAARQDSEAAGEACSGLCMVHFTFYHVCMLGIEKATCDSDEYPSGPREGCYCCISPPSDK